MSFSDIGAPVIDGHVMDGPVDDEDTDVEYDDSSSSSSSEEEEEVDHSEVDAEAAEFLGTLGLGAEDYLQVTLNAAPKVDVDVVLSVGSSYVKFAGSDCNVSLRPLMGRIRALVNGGVWERHPDHATISRPYGASDDFYEEMALKCHSVGKYIVPDALKLQALAVWAGHNLLQYVIGGDRLFVRFASISMQRDFEDENGVDACMVHEEGDVRL
jgi:hypothetical protein